MKILLILFFNGYLVLTSYSQNCFSYDNAGNRIKRQICIIAISPEENEYLQGLSSISYKGNRDVVKNNDLAELVIYPNPNSGTFRLKNQEEWKGAIISIVNNAGKFVELISISDNSIDLSHLPPGVYYIILNGDTNKKTAKLLITK